MVTTWSTWQLWLAHAWKHMLQFRGRWTIGFFPICSQIERLQAAKCRSIFRSGSLYRRLGKINQELRVLGLAASLILKSTPSSLVAHPTLQTSKRLDLAVVAQDAGNCSAAHAL
jgi:hypothetical protein